MMLFNNVVKQTRRTGITENTINKFGLIFLLIVSLSGFSSIAQEHSDSRWVTTWSTSPSTLPNSNDEPSVVEDQTLRLIVHSSIGGSSVRLRLSNLHSDHAIEIGSTAIALQAENASVQIGSSMQFSFAGEASVTIARGAVVFSDPLEFTVPQLSNLSVSLYIPQRSGFLTAHALANQTNFISEKGNYTTSTDLPVDSETPAWNLLTAIDVINDNAVTAIVTVGDSITDGWGSSTSANQRWPNHFARRMYNDESSKKFAIVNAGISGNRVTTEGNALFGQNLQARFERDVLALSNVSHMILMEGINDIGMSPGDDLIDASDIIAGYRQIIARAHANGIKIFGATLTPYADAAYYSTEGDLVRQQVNSFIRDSGEFDCVIDFEKVLQDPADPLHILPAFTEDNLHPNDAGYKAMSDSINLSLFD